ncbi:ORF6N domain-containing protein [Psychrobacillus sp. FSL K6-1464]|uniref:ORF6N domain-containing protein n=1 Tax=Psychrobacillus sp. FSL K6-1464 TaxID=2921545 RepID=UPI0030FB7886
MEIQVIEREGMRVLTTSQVSESFGIESKILLRNFQRNNQRFVEGEHYFALNGEALKEFKASRQSDATLKFASSLYLWSEQGAWMLAKSINNDKAWQAYELLVNNYYKVTSQLKSPEELIAIQNNKIVELEEKLEKTEKRVLAIESRVREQITLNSGEQIRLQKAVGERVYALEKDAGKRAALFGGIYRSIKVKFSVKSYRDVKQDDLQLAIKFVEKWNG